jgi:photosystem II stability/assembly factor-like uncharacterized protein
MKKFILIFVVTLLAHSTFYAQWTQVNTPGSSTTIFHDIDFVNDSVGFVTQSSSSFPILKTTDYGANWTQILSPAQFLKYQIDFTTELWGYGLDINEINRTVNGGFGWTVLKTADSREQFTDMHFINSSTGYVVSNQIKLNPLQLIGLVHKTVNSGVSWTTDTFPNIVRLNSVYFPSQDTGYIAGLAQLGTPGVIYKTYDAGATWMTTSLSQIGELDDIHFINNNVGYAVGISQTGFSNEILKTIDAGQTWTYRNAQPAGGISTDHLNLVRFVSPDTGYVSGLNNRFYNTFDGGQTWNTIPYTGNINDLYFINSNIGLLAGSNGQLLSMNNTATAINENISKDVKFDLYPNPATNTLIIKVNASNGAVEIRNNLGQIVLYQKLVSGKNVIPTNLTNGLYFVKYVINKKHSTQKLIISK